MDVGYFAYGSNLNIFQMMKRVGEWSSSTRVYLKGHDLVFNVKSRRWGGFAANIQKTGNDHDRVYGVVYFMKNEKLDVMTTYEGNSPKKLDVMTEDGEGIKDVAVYWWDKNEPSKEPPESYKQIIIEGLEQHGFKEDVIEKVKKSFLNRGT